MKFDQNHAAEAVKQRTEEYFQLLAELVRCPSTLGKERSAQELIYRHLQRMGLAAEMWDLDPNELKSQQTFAPVEWDYSGRPNVSARLSPAGQGGRSLVLNGHIDVVSPEPAGWWSYDPWGATISEGRMYGRGALDMKGGLVAALLAMQAIIDLGSELRGPVIFESVIEEECTGNGTLASRLRSGPVDGAVIPELTDLRALTATPGVIWFEVTVRGKPAYVGEAGKYVNAVETAAALMERLKPPMVQELNEAFTHPAYADYPQALTLSVGKISGGDWPSNVPLECRFTCRMSFPIGWSLEQVQTFVESHLKRAASKDRWLAEHLPAVRYPGFRALGWVMDDNVGETRSTLIQTLAGCHQAVTGKRLERDVFLATADARYFNVAQGEQAVYYGPSGGNWHAPDEYVELESILTVARVLAGMIVSWCG